MKRKIEINDSDRRDRLRLDPACPSVAEDDGFLIAAAGDEKLVTWHQSHSAGDREQKIDGLAPLHYAVSKNHFSAAKWLIEHDYPLNEPNAENKTLLELAAGKPMPSANMLNLLMSNNKEVDTTAARQEAHIAANGDNLLEGLFYALLCLPGNVHSSFIYINQVIENPLYYAVKTNNVRAAQYLIENNYYNVNIATPQHLTLLHVAVEHAVTPYDMIPMLINHGADIEAQCKHEFEDDTFSYTPLHLAIIKGDCHLVELLLTLKADINAPYFTQGDLGYSSLPLSLALGFHKDDLISSSSNLSRDCNPDADPIMAKFLIVKGTNIHGTDQEDGYTALHVAFVADFPNPQDHLDILDLLITHGADLAGRGWHTNLMGEAYEMDCLNHKNSYLLTWHYHQSKKQLSIDADGIVVDEKFMDYVHVCRSLFVLSSNLVDFNLLEDVLALDVTNGRIITDTMRHRYSGSLFNQIIAEDSLLEEPHSINISRLTGEFSNLTPRNNAAALIATFLRSTGFNRMTEMHPKNVAFLKQFLKDNPWLVPSFYPAPCSFVSSDPAITIQEDNEEITQLIEGNFLNVNKATIVNYFPQRVIPDCQQLVLEYAGVMFPKRPPPVISPPLLSSSSSAAASISEPLISNEERESRISLMSLLQDMRGAATTTPEGDYLLSLLKFVNTHEAISSARQVVLLALTNYICDSANGASAGFFPAAKSPLSNAFARSAAHYQLKPVKDLRFSNDEIMMALGPHAVDGSLATLLDSKMGSISTLPLTSNACQEGRR